MQPSKSKHTAPHDDALWAECLQRMLDSRARQPEGDGWKTSTELLEIRPMCRQRMMELLRAEIVAGRMEEFRGTQIVNGCPKPQRWYRPIRRK